MYLVFDTETTGLPKNYKTPITNLENWPRIIELGWMLYDNMRNIETSANYIIKPEGFTIPDDVVKIHGITTERALAEGTSLSYVLKEFNNVIARSKLLIAHNMEFDEKVVGAEFIRKAIPNALWRIEKSCTQASAKDFCAIPGNYGYKFPKLPELFKKLFNHPTQQKHDALSDTATCAECFFALLDRGIIKEPQVHYSPEVSHQTATISHKCYLCGEYVFVGETESAYDWTYGLYIHQKCQPRMISNVLENKVSHRIKIDPPTIWLKETFPELFQD
jgi:DNA polymerase III epsilon subunit-like protein